MVEIFSSRNYSGQKEVDNILDREWAKSTFLITDSELNSNSYTQFIKKNRYFNTADFKFTTSGPGLNMAVNPKPQFTRYCDLRHMGKIRQRNSQGTKEYYTPPEVVPGQYGLGMGGYYSEAIDDLEQKVFLRFGVPEYSNFLIWLNKAFDIDRVIFQNRGVITTTLLGLVDVVSKLFAVATAPLLAIGMTVMKLFFYTTRFYSVKETMYIYWMTVEDILNKLMVRRTLAPSVGEGLAYRLDNIINRENKVTSNMIEELNALIPDIIDRETGRISVYAIALRAQKVYNNVIIEDLNKIEELQYDFTGYQYEEKQIHDTYLTNQHGSTPISVTLLKTARNVADKLFTTEINEGEPVSVDKIINYGIEDSENNIPTNYSGDQNEILIQFVNDVEQKKKDDLSNFGKYLLAELAEGAAFAVFNVEYTGSVSESVSTSLKDNPIESVFNSISSQARNIGSFVTSAVESIPIVGDALKLAADAGAKILSNATFGLANPVLALLYGVNVSLPKQWEDTSFTFPRANYSIKLRSPYGNAYSQLFNIYLPLSMILAASLPRSTGASTYTSPFVCQVFDRGRVSNRLAIIESVNITRGTSNLGFSRSGHTNAIDVDISIASLEDIASVDITSTGLIIKTIKELDRPILDDSPFMDYLNTLASVDAYNQINIVGRFRLGYADKVIAIHALGDSAAWAAFTVDKILRPAKIFMGNNQAVLESLRY